METIIVGILSSLGGFGLAFYVIMKYYNNVRNCLNDIMSFLASTCGWFKTTYIKLSIETNGESSVRSLNRIVPELNLPELIIRWVKPDKHGKVRLEPGKAIVLLKYDNDNTQNIINTTAAYVRNTLLLNSKPFLDKGIKTAIDFAVIRAFLNRTPQKNYIVTQYVDNCSEDIDKYGDAFGKVTRVEDEGLFTRVLLREYAVWGNKLVGKTPSEKLVNESKDFLDFIYNIASRSFDEFTPLVFNESTLKVAVLLVAKYETFLEKGIDPYMRRIREGFANGINTFYLLARNEKIDILNKVYGQLMQTGNYDLLNGPEVYKDNIGRDNICYCIEVKRDGDMAKKYAKIEECIQNEQVVECSVTHIYRNEIIGDFCNLPVVIPRQEITNNENLKLKSYYSSGMTLEVIPLRVLDGGKILASTLKTKSNPQNLFNNSFSVNSKVNAIVESADDNYISLLVKETSQKCIAYRRNITYSRFAFLHDLFPVGNEYEFIIKEIDYIHNCLELKLNPLLNPWDNISFNEGERLEIIVFNKNEYCIETELEEGIYAILPYSELSWFDNEIETIKNSIKRNQTITVTIKKIDVRRRLVVLSCKESKSPYIEFFNNMPNEKSTVIKVETQNAYGIIGSTESKYKIFVPKSETFIGANSLKVYRGKEYPVKILEVDERGLSLVGTFKPYIEKPLKRFSEKFSEGQILSHLKVARIGTGGIWFDIQYGKNKHEEALLFVSEISDCCYISDLKNLFDGLYTCPMVIKKIDFYNNIILLSVKDLAQKNKVRLQNLKYGTIYKGKTLGKHKNNYCVLLDNIWAEVLVESKGRYQTGDDISVIKSSSEMFVDEKDV